MGKVVAVQGVSNVGKSTAIRAAYDAILAKYPSAMVSYRLLRKDVRAVITIDGVKIGIESQGDPGSRLLESLKLFVKEGCDLIVCATRTSGATVEALNRLGHRYDIEWIRHRSLSGAERSTQHGVTVERILEVVRKAVRRRSGA
jgi:hypothetical protein